jgi:hypothetical protein
MYKKVICFLRLFGHLFFHLKVCRHISNNCGILHVHYFNIIYVCELLKTDSDYSVRFDKSCLVISISICFYATLFLSRLTSFGFLLLNSEVSAFSSLLFSVLSEFLCAAGKNVRWINLILSTAVISTQHTYINTYRNLKGGNAPVNRNLSKYYSHFLYLDARWKHTKQIYE